ncbi:MAG: hypothetical protein DME26_22070, partial [Verrucomicrobia bacterium]
MEPRMAYAARGSFAIVLRTTRSASRRTGRSEHSANGGAMVHLARKLGVSFALVPLLFAACGRPSQSVAQPVREGSVRLGDLVQHYRRSGQGTPLLLIHGLTNTWRVWRPHIETLAATHDLIIPDLRGHGDTPNPAATLTPNQVAQDMLAL